MSTIQIQNFTAATSVASTDVLHLSQSGTDKKLAFSVLAAAIAAAYPLSQAAFTLTTGNFTQPAVNSTVNVPVVNSQWMATGQIVFIAGAGAYQVTALPTTTSALLMNIGATGAAVAGTSITTGASVVASGQLGPTGPASYTTTTASFTMPASGSSVNVSVVSTAWMIPGMSVYMGTAGYMTVASVVSSTVASLTNAGAAGNASSGATVPTSQSLVAAGSPGLSGTNGANAYTAATSSFTQPAVGSNVVVSVSSTAWMSAGQTVYVATGGYYSVVSIGSGTSVTLQNMGTAGNTVPSVTINSGSAVSASGLPGANSYTTLTASFTQPASGSTVSVSVVTTAWMAQGQVLFIAGGGYYTLTSITDGTHAVLSNLGYSANASPGATVTSGATVTAGGTKGQDGSGSGTVTSVAVSSANGFAGSVSTATTTPTITLSTSVTGLLKGNGTAMQAAVAGTDYAAPGTATSFTAQQTFSGSTSVFAAAFANAKELTNVVGSALGATPSVYVASGATTLVTANAANNVVPNIAFSSGTTLNAAMSVGDTVTVALLLTQGATAYYVTGLQIDGSAVTPKWLGGTSPTAGNASGIDAYTFTITKTAASTYTVLAAQSQYK